MKIKCAVYDCFNLSEPIGYCFVDLDDPVISYSTYRRLKRLSSYNSNIFISAPVDDYKYCRIDGYALGSVVRVLIKPFGG